MKNITVFAALLSLIGVILGAFGAHALQETLAKRQMTEVWETAIFYHLLHSLAAWALGHSPRTLSIWHRWAGRSWLVGILLFSGSLYALALGGPKILGPVTPLGGLFLISGWAFAAIAAAKSTESAPK